MKTFFILITYPARILHIILYCFTKGRAALLEAVENDCIKEWIETVEPNFYTTKTTINYLAIQSLTIYLFYYAKTI